MIYNAMRWGCSAAKSAKCQKAALEANGHRIPGTPYAPQHPGLLFWFSFSVSRSGTIFLPRPAVRKLKVYVNFDKSLHY